MSEQAEPTAPEKGFQGVLREAKEFWQQMPHKSLFIALAACWALLFQFLGNSTLGYIKTASLFGWMNYVYSTSPDDAHGNWIPFVVIALAWWKRRELLAVPKRLWWPGLILLGAAVLLHGIGFLVQQTRLSIVAFFVGLWAIGGVVWGFHWLKATFFPFILFAFCVPLGTEADRITFPLRVFATDITVWVCRTILGIEVVQNGTQIFDPGGNYQYEVAAACGGIRSLTTTLALALGYAFVVFKSPWRRALITFSGIPLAILSNVVRLTSVIVAAAAFGQNAGVYVHDSWWISLLPYLLGFGGLAGLGALLREGKPRSSEAAGAGMTEPAGGYSGHRPAVGALSLPRMSAHAWVLATIALLLTVGAGGLIYRFQATQRLGIPGLKVVAEPVFNQKGDHIGSHSVYLPPDVPGFTSTNSNVDQIVLDWLPKDTTYGNRIYQAADGFQIRSSVVLMGTDRGSIHKPQICLKGQGWRIDATQPQSITVKSPHEYELPVMRLTVGKDLSRKDGTVQKLSGVYVYWFVADGQLTADHMTRMWWMSRDLMSKGILQRWAYVTYFAPCPPGLEDITYSRMKNLIIDSVPHFQLAAGPNPQSQSSPSAQPAVAGLKPAMTH